MATSLYVPLAYITILVTSLAIFSRVYRRRKAAEKTSWEPWFPSHPQRDTYISLLSSDPSPPDSILKSALLARAIADVKRIWRIRDDKAAITSLHARGLVGDDTMARFGAAEKELEAEVVDVVQEANTFRQGWGQLIFATATEMAHAERTRETVMAIPKIKAIEDRKIALRKQYLPDNLPLLENDNDSSALSSAKVTPPAGESDKLPTPQKVPLGSGSQPGREEGGSASGSGTPAKTTPGKKNKKKKERS